MGEAHVLDCRTVEIYQVEVSVIRRNWEEFNAEQRNRDHGFERMQISFRDDQKHQSQWGKKLLN